MAGALGALLIMYDVVSSKDFGKPQAIELNCELSGKPPL
jgi:hypothetical protein